MIGKLSGRLDEVGPSTLIVDVNGVGYEVTCAARTLASLPAVGETVTLAIDTHLREDSIRLYGFATDHERAWFRALQTVQGVGAKVGLFEPIHGSAPDIAGKNIANPIATIASGAMMLSYAFQLDKEAAAIEQAIVKTLELGFRTKDIHAEGMRLVGTTEMGDAIVKNLPA